MSFDVFRTLGMGGVTALKPEQMFAARETIRSADWVLFPEEWQINPIIHTLGTRVFPSVASYRFGQDKVQFTRAMWMAAPEHMPQTLILPADESGARQALEALGLPMVVKRPRASMGQGVHLIESRKALLDLLPQLDVLYAQEVLPISRDLRVVWIGDRVVSAYWRHNAGNFLNNVAQGGTVDFGPVPQVALDLVARVATALGIDHAGFDLAEVDGHWSFFEANVRFGNDGLRLAGVDVASHITAWLERNTPGIDDPHKPDEPEHPDGPDIEMSA